MTELGDIIVKMAGSCLSPRESTLPAICNMELNLDHQPTFAKGLFY